MGLFSGFKQSLAESPGRVLLQQVGQLAEKFGGLPPHIRQSALVGYVQRRNAVIANLDNMTVEGTFKLGVTLQREGRKAIDVNMSDGYAILMTGIWLESMNRPGAEAARAHQILNDLADSV